uniref:Uncharacterized protein n=1 Tax=Schistocephalus solidus TaxID=70667 RepID=A0A0X3Q6S6_SCHSO
MQRFRGHTLRDPLPPIRYAFRDGFDGRFQLILLLLAPTTIDHRAVLKLALRGALVSALFLLLISAGVTVLIITVNSVVATLHRGGILKRANRKAGLISCTQEA